MVKKHFSYKIIRLCRLLAYIIYFDTFCDIIITLININHNYIISKTK